MDNVELLRKKNKREEKKKKSLSSQTVFTKYFKVGYITHCYLLFNLKAAFFIRLFANNYQLKKAASIWKAYSKIISLFLESKSQKCCTSVRFLLHRISKYFSVYISDLVPSLMKY